MHISTATTNVSTHDNSTGTDKGQKDKVNNWIGRYTRIGEDEWMVPFSDLIYALYQNELDNNFVKVREIYW